MKVENLRVFFLSQLPGITHFNVFVQALDSRKGMIFEQNAYPIFGNQGQVEKVVIFARDITQRSLAEEALKESEANLRTLIRTLPDLVWLKDKGGVYLFCNSRFEEFFGAEEKEIIGKTDYDFVDKELADFFIQNDQLAMTKGVSHLNEEKITFASDGHSEILETIKTPLYGNDGQLTGVLGIGRDITERKQAEAMLRYRIELEKLIADVSTRFVGISSDQIDAEINRTLQHIGQFTQIDRSYLFMISEDGAVINNTHEWHAEGIQPQKEKLQDISVNDIPWWLEKLERNETIHVPVVKDMPDTAGNEKAILQQQNIQSLLVVPLVAGPRLIGFIGFDSVRTEKSWTEEDKILLRTIAELIAQKLEGQRIETAHRENEEKYRKLFENAQIGLFRTRVDDGLVLEANQRLADMFGYGDKNELIGHHYVKNYYVDPEERQQMIAELRKKKEINNYEARFRKKDGTFCWLRLSGTLHEEKGYFEGVLADITETKEAEAERTLLQEQYRQAQKVEAIGRLAGGVAHDMNNLLTPILGYGELLLDDFSPDDRRRESLAQIVRAGNSARNLVRQLLAFGRKQTLNYRPLDLNKTIHEFKKLLRHTIREDIAIDIIPSPGLPVIKADIGQIEQVIMNLSVNAQDAMPGGGRLILETAMEEISAKDAAGRPGTKPGAYVRLTVRDTGCGMDEKTQHHVFEPFFSTKGERGTGLGLATVYGIIKQHGGNIWVHSQVGQGTAFKIYLPVSEEQCIDSNARKESTPKMNGSEVILLVEDNKQVRDLGRIFLTELGYTVLVAESGPEALIRLAVHDGPVHLLLTDVVMPRMNGRELYAKAVLKYPHLKVLYMSGYDDELIHRHGILNEHTAFIQKPFTGQSLAVKVRGVLEAKPFLGPKKEGLTPAV